MRKPSSPGTTELRPWAKGDISRALCVVSQSANGGGDVDVVALVINPTAGEREVDFELSRVVSLLQTERKPRKRPEASATGSTQGTDLGAFLGMPLTQAGSSDRCANRPLTFLDAASLRWTLSDWAPLSNGTGSGRNAVSPETTVMTDPC